MICSCGSKSEYVGNDTYICLTCTPPKEEIDLYFSAQGNDANLGLSPDFPKKTLKNLFKLGKGRPIRAFLSGIFVC